MLNVLNITFPFSDTTDTAAFLAHAEGAASGGLQIDVSQSYVWASVIGLIYVYTGDSMFSPLVINSLAGAYIVILGYRISDILFRDGERPLYVAGILAIMPPLVFISATYLRDVTTTLFFTMFVYHLLRFGLIKNPPTSSLLILLLSSALAAMLHGAFVLLPAFVLLYMLLRSLTDGPGGHSVRTYSMTALAMSALVLAFFLFGVGASKAGVLYGNSVELIRQRIIDTASSGLMAEQTDVLLASPPLFALLAIAKFLFSPFFAEQLRAFDALRYPIVAYLFISFIKLVANAVPYPFTEVRVSFSMLIVLLLAYCFLFSIGSLDSDTAFRHYIKLLPVLIAAGAPLGLVRRPPEHVPASGMLR